ncbi:GNAT family N-acetyltransferase [Microbacterium esteraromaticum]|uniref:GNAT family N-acetyltransferase n=1 Tax=Microbacterium esteraromaticum TaxID=57043 RepID=A0A7D7WH70_9MICO|nr:GNAT family N-acetyltransferase [Microbacterium esteraromaticum]QMU98512.1 GNAT family N-acetyltransferase [Microbacterium esteraromaticum]
MATITTEPATITRWDDVQHSLSGGGDGRSCQCIWPVVRNKVWQATSLDERRDMLHDEVAAGPPPGLIAYVDGEAAGWIRVGPRTVQQRILNTRAILAATAEPLDDDSVWAVTCFVVRKEHRGKGLNAELLASALDFARESGARMIEAYPVDTSTGSHRSNDLFHGTLSTFLAAGFDQGPTLTGGRVLVTRGLAD